MRLHHLAVTAMATTLACSAASAAGLSDLLKPFEYTQSNLVADQSGIAVTTDPALIDPWGVTFQPTGAFWVSDHGAGAATLYDGNGTKVNPNFTIPPGVAGTATGQPTGIVANPTKAFLVPGTTLPAAFIFATLDGTISAWAPNLSVNPTNAVLAVDKSAQHAVYTGMDFGITSAGGFLYAANVNTASIDVFNTRFQPASASLTGSFRDPSIPAGFTPFNVRNIDGNLVVTYAEQNAARNFVTTGAGLGYVDEFDTNGNLLAHIAGGGFLNAPWGVARAPAGFGAFGGDIMIGDFGDGHIFGFNNGLLPINLLLDRNGLPVTLPGLWTLQFGGGAGSSPDTLFFSEGVGKGQHGLFGSFTPVVPVPGGF
jgi:uncharacterized protein (TIGR03118 family)